MPNPRLAARYAKSLIDLATEKGQLEAVYADMQYLQSVCKTSREFVNMLVSPIIKGDKKGAIIHAVTQGKISAITEGFNKLLVSKGRESDLPEIASAFIDQYNTIKGIHKVKLITAVPVSEELKNSITGKFKGSQTGSIQLETKVDERLIGGFVLEFDNNIIDTSILNDLKQIKKQFAGNDYVNKMH